MKKWTIRWAYWLGQANLLLVAISFVLWILQSSLNFFRDGCIVRLDHVLDTSWFILFISMHLIFFCSYACAIAYLLTKPFSYLFIRVNPELQQYNNALVNILMQPRQWMVKVCIKCMCVFLLIWTLLSLMSFVLPDIPDVDLFGMLAYIISLLTTIPAGFGSAIGIGYLFIRLCTWATPRISKARILHAEPIKCLLYATVIAFQILSYLYILGG